MAIHTDSRPSFEARARARAPTGERNCARPGMTVIVWGRWYDLPLSLRALISPSASNPRGLLLNFSSWSGNKWRAKTDDDENYVYAIAL
jgi:hypothetical protein